jgi:hypothetical protein
VNGKGLVTWAAISAAIGVFTAWISITQLVIDPLKTRLELGRENVLRDMVRMDTLLREIDKRLRDLERSRGQR